MKAKVVLQAELTLSYNSNTQILLTEITTNFVCHILKNSLKYIF